MASQHSETWTFTNTEEGERGGVGGSMACCTPVRLTIYPTAARKSVVIKMKCFPRENGRFASPLLLFARQGVSQAGR